MSASESVAHRSQTRAFVPDQVSKKAVRVLLGQSAHAPCGGNLQPWHAQALTGDPLKQLVELVKTNGPAEAPAYAICLQWDPDRANRFRTRASLVGVDVRQFFLFEETLANARIAQLLEWAGQRALVPAVSARFPFADFAETMKFGISGKGWGKRSSMSCNKRKTVSSERRRADTN